MTLLTVVFHFYQTASSFIVFPFITVALTENRLQVNLSTYTTPLLVTLFGLSFSGVTVNWISPYHMSLPCGHLPCSPFAVCQIPRNSSRALFSVSCDLTFQNQLSIHLGYETGMMLQTPFIRFSVWVRLSFRYQTSRFTFVFRLWQLLVKLLWTILMKCPVSPHKYHTFLLHCPMPVWPSCFPMNACPVPLILSKPVWWVLLSFNLCSLWISDCWT